MHSHDDSRPSLMQMPRPRRSRLQALTPAANSGLPEPAPHAVTAFCRTEKLYALESSSERIPAISEAGAAGCRSALRTQLLAEWARLRLQP